MDTLTLPPELERFAAEAVAAGEYRDASEVVAAGLRLLQGHAAARAEFAATLEAAEAESEQLGFVTIDEVDARVREIIGRARRTAA